MAFNPFRTFRKHQKVLFAALTILVMLIFVFTYSGAGGGRPYQFFEDLAKSIGLVKKPNNTKVTEVDGHKVSEQDLMDLSAKRLAVTEMWLQANNEASGAISAEVQTKMQTIKDDSFSMDELTRLRTEEATIDATFEYLCGKDAMQTRQMFKQFRNFEGVLPFMAKVINEGVHQRRLSVDALLDFMMWQKKADSLNITLTDDDTAKIFKKESYGKKKLDDAISDLQRHSKFGRFKPEELKKMFTEEFRVRLAMETYLGGDGPTLRMPGQYTAYDFDQYFKKHRTQDTIAVLPIPVEAYLDQVKETPSDKDLQSLFNSRKEELPAPDREKPGFKEPHRIEVEWLTVNAKSPNYTIAATLAPSLAPFLSPFGVTMYDVQLLDEFRFETSKKSNFTEESSNSIYRAPWWNDPTFAQSYSATLYPIMQDHRPECSPMVIGQLMMGSSIMDRIVPLVSYQVEGALTPGLARHEIVRRETEQHEAALTQLKASLLLGGLDQSLGGLGSFALIAGERTSIRQGFYVPYDVVKDEIAIKDRDNLINGRADRENAFRGPAPRAGGYKAEHLAAINKELEGLKNKSEGDARKIIEDLLEKHVLYRLTDESLEKLKKDGVADALIEKLTKIKDQYFFTRKGFLDEVAKTITADELKPVEDKVVKSADKLALLEHDQSDKPRDFYELHLDPHLKRIAPEKQEPGDFRFADSFFQDGLKVFDVAEKKFGPTEKEETFLWWKSMDIPPRVPKFEEAKPKVLEAWRLSKARELARAEAVRLIDNARAEADKLGRKTPYPADALKNLSQQREELLAMFKKEPTDSAWPVPFDQGGLYLLDDRGSDMRSRSWKPSVPDKKNILYPPADFTKRIHEKLDTIGDAIIMTDKPGKFCYVVVLTKREVPETSETGKQLASFQPGSLREHMEQELVGKDRSQKLHDLRLKAGLDTDELETDSKKVDEYGNPKYKKTYEVSEDLIKKLQSDTMRE